MMTSQSLHKCVCTSRTLTAVNGPLMGPCDFQQTRQLPSCRIVKVRLFSSGASTDPVRYRWLMSAAVHCIVAPTAIVRRAQAIASWKRHCAHEVCRVCTTNCFRPGAASSWQCTTCVLKNSWFDQVCAKCRIGFPSLSLRPSFEQIVQKSGVLCSWLPSAS